MDKPKETTPDGAHIMPLVPKYETACSVCGKMVERSVRKVSRRITCWDCKESRRVQLYKEKTKKKKVLEKDIQRKICDYLATQKYFFWRSNNVPVFSMSGSGFKRFFKLPKYTPRGIPDILMVYKGMFFGFEVKRPDSPSKTGNRFQEAFGEAMTANGAVYKVVYSVEDVQAVIKQYSL